MNFLRVIWAHFRISLLNEMAYRANLVMQFLQIGIRLSLSLVSISVVYRYTETLNGWQPAELIAMIGVYFMVDGLVNMIIQPNMNLLMNAIRTGGLDFVLTKPVDAQVMISAQTFHMWKVIDTITGAIVLTSALVRLGVTVSVGHALLFALTVLVGLAMIYSVLLMLATLTFWLIKIDNILVFFQSLYDAGRWPVGIYPQWLRLMLTFLVPVSFAVTVPTEAIIGRLTLQTGSLALLMAAGLLVLSRLLWRRGIQRYSGASS